MWKRIKSRPEGEQLNAWSDIKTKQLTLPHSLFTYKWLWISRDPGFSGHKFCLFQAHFQN